MKAERPGVAALLAIRIGKAHPLVGDAVNVWRAIAHQPVAVAKLQVGNADVIAPDDENVWFPIWHFAFLLYVLDLNGRSHSRPSLLNAGKPVVRLMPLSAISRQLDRACDSGIAINSGLAGARPWHCLYLRPLPHGHGSLRGTSAKMRSSAGITSFTSRPLRMRPAMIFIGNATWWKNSLKPAHR